MHRDAHVGIVLVGGIVQVDDLGPGGEEDRLEILDNYRLFGILHLGTGKGELNLASVLADIGGLALLDDATFCISSSV